jgi:hypothetical protein
VHRLLPGYFHHYEGTRGDHSKTQYFNQNILNEVEPHTFCSFDAITATVLTFDSDHSSAPSAGKLHLEAFLASLNDLEADLLVLCMQEIDAADKWSQNIQKALLKRGYVLLTET